MFLLFADSGRRSSETPRRYSEKQITEENLRERLKEIHIYRIIYIGFRYSLENRCKLLRNLVGLPRFELGTACTPSKKYQSLTRHAQ